MSGRVSAWLFLAATACAAGDETLTYSVNWPSGLSLGEATYVVRQGGTEISLTLEANVPGVPIKGEFLSSLNSGCTTRFSKSYTFGPRIASETTTVDSSGQATRETKGGGKSEFAAGMCPRDALAFVQFVRQELKSGRLPNPQNILFGAQYRVQMQYSGTAKAPLGGEMIETDRLVVNVKGPASETAFEMQFARDPGRTPVLVRVPFAMGTFSVELVR